MADIEINNQIADDDTPLGEPLTVADLPDEFGDLSDMNDFAFLNDDDIPPGETEAGTEVEQPVAASVPADKPAEPESAAPDPQVTEKLEAYERLDTALRENPAQAIKAIFAGMDPRDRAALATELGTSTSQAPAQAQIEAFDVADYEPQGEMEEALRSRWSSIEAIPAIIEAQNTTDQRIEQGFAAFVPHVTDANIAAQLALTKIEAICEALGIELPDPDGAAVTKTLQGGKTTYRDAVRAAANYRTQVDTHKQARRPRPETPGGGPRSVEKIASGTDAVTIARRLGVLPPR